MHTKNNHSLWRWVGIAAILVLAFVIQLNIRSDSDVNWLMMVTQKMLAGQHYYTSYFETNPPMILYLYTPAALISSFFHINYRIPFLIYALCAFFGVIYLSKSILSTFIDEHQNWLLTAILLTIAFISVIMPASSFGQRDHLTMVLTLPYLFLVAARAEERQFHFVLPLTVGILAGLGFSLKPYFLFVLIFPEIYLMIKQRRWTSWFRTEALAIGGIFVLYLISIFIIAPNYIYKILPLVYDLYYPGLPWYILLAAYRVMFFFVALGLFVIMRGGIRYRTLADVLMLGVTGFLLSYLFQRTLWYYHFIPLFGSTTLLLVVLLVAENRLRHITARALSLVLLCAFSLAWTFCENISCYWCKANFPKNEYVQFLKTHCGDRCVFVFSTVIPDTYFFTNVAHFIPASRFPSFMVLGGLFKQLGNAKTPERRTHFAKRQQEIFDMVAQDLQRRPEWLVVDVAPAKAYIRKEQFEYLRYFSQDPRIKKTLETYYYVTKIHHFAIYRSSKI